MSTATNALRAVAIALASAHLFVLPAHAAPGATCYVREIPAAAPANTDEAASGPTAAAPAAAAPAGTHHLGLRRKTDKLFDVDISVSGPGDATCAVSGVAKLQGEPGSEVLGLVIRPDPSRKSGRSGTLCQVFIRLAPTAVELETTPTSCQAQALCGNRVDLNGLRFEPATRLPADAKGPCFGAPPPADKR